MLLVNRVKPGSFTRKFFEVCIPSGKLFIYDDQKQHKILSMQTIFFQNMLKSIFLGYHNIGFQNMIFKWFHLYSFSMELNFCATKYHLTTQNVYRFPRLLLQNLSHLFFLNRKNGLGKNKEKLLRFINGIAHIIEYVYT